MGIKLKVFESTSSLAGFQTSHAPWRLGWEVKDQNMVHHQTMMTQRIKDSRPVEHRKVECLAKL